jgi:CarD family transcriptional regulator
MTTAVKKKAPAPAVASKSAPVKAAQAKVQPNAKPLAAKPVASVKAVAPAKPAPQAPVKPVATLKPVPVPAKPVAAPRVKHEFKVGDFVVYPTHGVGRIQKIDEQEVAGIKLELFVIGFEKDKMILRVPTMKAKAVGMRKLSSPDVVATALNTLKGRARIKRTMWSRRAQEYEAKINSGDLIAIAEVVRDLFRSENQPEQSYSERQLYEAALDRMLREIAVVEDVTDTEAQRLFETNLRKGPRRGAPKPAEEAEVAQEEAA